MYSNKANKGRLYKYLRHKNKMYHNRSNTYQRRGIIIDRVMIDKPPKIVEKKHIGDLEIDTVIGKDHRGVLVTAVDRKSKYTVIKKVASKHAEAVTATLVEILEPLKPILKTITSDNCKEFAYHKEVSEILETDFYFTHPYHSGERGLNKHTNGLIINISLRKPTLLKYLRRKSLLLQEKLNHRSRKIFGYRTPYEVFFREVAKKLAA